jgi:hypothetical protein
MISVGMFYMVHMHMVDEPYVGQHYKYYHVDEYILKMAMQELMDINHLKKVHIIRRLYIEDEDRHHYSEYAVGEGRQPIR